MEEKQKNKRWTILDTPLEWRKLVTLYAKENGFTIARALVELTAKELKSWKEKNKQ